MCLNPLKLRNKKLSVDINVFTDRLFNYVNCGKCEECLELYKNEWFVRALYHFKYYRDVLHGRVFFYTLTYNNDNLPSFQGNPCFDKKDLQDFIKRVRSYIGIDKKFTYFITSEYGPQTHRPHYHCLFYTTGLNSSDIKYIIEKEWQKGFVKAGEHRGIVINDDAIKYVAKYVNKDYGTFNYISDKTTSVEFDFLIKDYNKKNNRGLSFKNFHIQSEGFGSYMLDCLDFNDYVNGSVSLVVSSKKNSNLSKYFPIPLYIRRKYMYDVEKNSQNNPVYRLNYRGIQIKRACLSSQINLFVQNYINIISDIDTLYPLSYFKRFGFSLDYVNSKMLDVDVLDLASYFVFYRSIPMFDAFYSYSFKSIYKTFDNYFGLYVDPLLGYKVIKYYNRDDYDEIIGFYLHFLSIKKYEKYKENVIAYNTNQYYRFLVTGIYKPIQLKKFDVFCSGYFNFVKNCFINKKYQNLKYLEYLDNENEKMFNSLKIALLCIKNCFNHEEKEALPFPPSSSLECPF